MARVDFVTVWQRARQYWSKLRENGADDIKDVAPAIVLMLKDDFPGIKITPKQVRRALQQ